MIKHFTYAIIVHSTVNVNANIQNQSFNYRYKYNFAHNLKYYRNHNEQSWRNIEKTKKKRGKYLYRNSYNTFSQAV